MCQHVFELLVGIHFVTMLSQSEALGIRSVTMLSQSEVLGIRSVAMLSHGEVLGIRSEACTLNCSPFKHEMNIQTDRYVHTK